MRVYVRYDNNVNAAYFDNFALTLDGAQCYTYDDKGNVVAVNRTNTDEIANVYSGADLISSTGGANGMFEYEYDSKHNVTKVKNAGLTLALSYDSNGNATSSRLEEGTKYATTSATYTDGGTKVGTVTDNLGAKVINNYKTGTDLLRKTRTTVSDTNPNNGAFESKTYTYDSVDRTTGISDGDADVTYSYASGNLSVIGRSETDNSAVSQEYTFTYNKFGQRISVRVGDNTLAEYTYNDTTHNLERMTYGNGRVVEYAYDKYDRLKYKDQADEDEYVYYYYDYLGNVIKEEYKCLDIIDKAYYYEYDRLGRLIRSYESEDGVIVSQTEQTYDSKGRDESYSYDGDGLSYGYEYGYNDKD